MKLECFYQDREDYENKNQLIELNVKSYYMHKTEPIIKTCKRTITIVQATIIDH